MDDAALDRSRHATLAHIAQVQARMAEVAANLRARAEYHDASKLEEPELSGYARLTARLADIPYGSAAYAAALAEARETIDHHYAHNRHHPQHWPNGIADMSLLDLIEMLCDWKAASMRTKDGSLEQSLAINRARFGSNDLLASIFENTRKELEW